MRASSTLAAAFSPGLVLTMCAEIGSPVCGDVLGVEVGLDRCRQGDDLAHVEQSTTGSHSRARLIADRVRARRARRPGWPGPGLRVACRMVDGLEDVRSGRGSAAAPVSGRARHAASSTCAYSALTAVDVRQVLVRSATQDGQVGVEQHRLGRRLRAWCERRCARTACGDHVASVGRPARCRPAGGRPGLRCRPRWWTSEGRTPRRGTDAASQHGVVVVDRMLAHQFVHVAAHPHDMRGGVVAPVRLAMPSSRPSTTSSCCGPATRRHTWRSSTSGAVTAPSLGTVARWHGGEDPCDPGPMAVLIDEPRWWFRGRRWSHLVSDESLDELHAFADLTGIPRRGFQGDHYDVPEEVRDDLLGCRCRAGGEPRAGASAARRRSAAEPGRAPGPRRLIAAITTVRARRSGRAGTRDRPGR